MAANHASGQYSTTIPHTEKQVAPGELEIFNKVLKEAAKLAVKHKLDGLPIELRPGELVGIYRKYADINDFPLFKRFAKYLKSPEGREFFNKTIRIELWKAGYRPKWWEEYELATIEAEPLPDLPQSLIEPDPYEYGATKAWGVTPYYWAEFTEEDAAESFNSELLDRGYDSEIVISGAGTYAVRYAYKKRGLPQTRKYFVKIRERNSSAFNKGSIISWEEFEADDKKVRERGERPASVEIVKEPPPGNGGGDKEGVEGQERGQDAMATVQADQVRGHLPIQTWQQYPRLNGKPVLPWARETFGLARKEQMSSLKPVTAKHGRHIFGFFPDAGEYLGNIVVWDKGSWPAFEYYIETTMAEWATRMGVPSPEYFITDYDEDIVLTSENKILIPKALVQAFRHDKPLGLLFAIAHEFGHWVVEARGLHINEAEEEAFANKTAEELSGVPWEDELVALHDILPKVYRKVSGGRSLRQAVADVKAAKAKGNYLAKTIQDDKFVPALRPFEPYEFAEYVLRFNRFSDAEIPIYSGLSGENPLRVPDHIWREVIGGTEGEFVKQGDLNIFHIPEKGRPEYMRAAPTWRDITSTIPTKSSTPNPREEMEFIADSPELIPFNIEDIGYRNKLDNAFEEAIARARGGAR